MPNHCATHGLRRRRRGNASEIAEIAEQRWDAVATLRPDLAPALALQRRLIAIVSELSQSSTTSRLPRAVATARVSGR